MTEKEAQQIGSRQGIISVIVGIIIAQLIMISLSYNNSLLKAFFWFTDFGYNLNICIAVVIMLLSGYFFGQYAGKSILIKKRNYALTGCLCGIAILLTTAFLSSWVGFFQEGISNIGTEDDPFVDYIYKPVFWVFFFGIIPTLIVGIWFGKQIKKQGYK